MQLNKPDQEKIEIFSAELWLPQPRDAVFEFFRKADNLEILTPPWLNFRILTPGPITISEGQIIDYVIRLFGVGFRWQSKITLWQPPHQFADIQLKGPYKVWRHVHSFVEKDGGTLMRDEVRYRARGAFFAPLIHRLFVTRNVAEIFAYRRRKISEVFGIDSRANAETGQALTSSSGAA